MSKIIVVFLYLSALIQAFAFTSSHAVITPKNLSKHNEFKVWLYSDKDDPEMVNIILPFHEGGKKYWLFSSNRELTDKELEFRSLIWISHKPVPCYITQIVPIAPLLNDTGKASGTEFIRLKLRKELLAKSYIYHDFAVGVDGGGWCRTYRLSSFPIGDEEFDPIMEEEMNISRYRRSGDNQKRRESEELLRKLLASEPVMERWGKRYQAEQDGGNQPAIDPESNPEDKETPEAGTKQRS